jgi:hypothetical protein
MTRGPRTRPIVPPSPADVERAVDRIHRLWRKDAAAALERCAGRADLLALVRARRAAERGAAGDVAGALAEAREACSLPGAPGDAVAGGLLAAAAAEAASGDGAGAEGLLLEAHEAAEAPLCRGTALGRLALLYLDRGIPLGFRFYAPRALRVLDRGRCTGIHPEADRDAARLATAVLEYHHRRDEPERSGRAYAVLDRVRDADPAITVRGLRCHGVALGKLQEWDAAWKVFAEAARIAEERDLRGCDGVFVYAAALKVHEKDFPGARRLLGKVHIRRLDRAEKDLYRRFRHLVEAAAELKPLSGEKAEKFLRAQKRREKARERKALEAQEVEAVAAAAPAAAPAGKAARKAGARAVAKAAPRKRKRPA